MAKYEQRGKVKKESPKIRGLYKYHNQPTSKNLTKTELKYFDQFGKDYKQRSKASLYAEISFRARQVSFDIMEAQEKSPRTLENNFVKGSLHRLELYSGVKRNVNGLVPVGSSKRSKELLIRQARELKAFQKWDIYTPNGKRKLEKRADDAYNQFLLSHGYTKDIVTMVDDKEIKEVVPDPTQFPRSQWSHMVEVFGAIGDDVITNMSSDQWVRLYTESSKKGQLTFLDAYTTLKDEFAKRGMDIRDNKVQQKFMKAFKEWLKLKM